MIKKNLLILAIMAFPLSVFLQDKVVDQIVAVVGNNIILKSDIEKDYLQLVMEGIDTKGDLKCQVFENLLFQKLLLNQAMLDSLVVSDAEVEQRLTARFGFLISQAGSEQALEDYFKRSVFEIKNDLRSLLRDQLYTQKMQQKITENIRITPSEVRKYFKELPEDGIPLINAQVEVAQIVVKPVITDAEINQVKDRLNDFISRIQGGDKFTALARLYSEDPGTARNGGELGYISRKDNLLPEFIAVAFNLTTPGEISRIVETEYGFHIIQLIDRKGEKINVRHILLTPRVSYEEQQKAINLLDSLNNLIRNGTLTFEEAAMRYSQDEDTKMGGGTMINLRTGLSRFDTDEIDKSLYQVIRDLKPGEISEPFEARDERNKLMYKVVRLKTRTTPHAANLKEDYQYLQEMALEKKKQDAMNEWITSKQKETYIKINGSFRNCSFENTGWVR
jgi:peptidyl-prolyl cis-trans isomerase SurA